MFLLKRKEPALTLAERALLRAKQMDARVLFAGANVVLWVLIFYTSHRFPHKFVRVTGECQSNWLHVDSAVGSEAVCCDGESRALPCHAGMALSEVLASPKGAWVLPLTPLVFNYVSLMLLEEPTMPRIRVVVRRGALYLALMLFRTFALYVGLNQVEQLVTRVLFGSAADSACWYKDLRRSKRCAPHFDHSDHVVLLVAHYFAVLLFEWFALSVELPAATWRTSVKKAVLQLWMLLLAALASYTLFFTTSFFHTSMENVVAVVVAQAFVMAPLFLVTQDYFATHTLFRLRNFVLFATYEDIKTQ